MLKKHTKPAALFFAIALIISLAVPLFALATKDVSIDPIRRAEGKTKNDYFYFEVKPGEKISDGFMITNLAKEPKRYLIFPVDAISTDSGQLGGKSDSEKQTDMGSWIKFPSREITLGPSEKKKVYFDMEIPADAKTGDHLAFIYLMQAPPEHKPEPAPTATSSPSASPSPEDKNKKEEKVASFGVTVLVRLGTCAIVRVAGNYTKGIDLEKLDKKIEKGGLSLVLSMKNTGNTYLKVKTKFTLKNKNNETVAKDATALLYMLPDNSINLGIPLKLTRPLPKGQYTAGFVVETEKEKLAEKEFIIKLP